MTDHRPPGWWPTPPRRSGCPIVVAALVAMTSLMVRGLISWIR